MDLDARTRAAMAVVPVKPRLAIVGLAPARGDAGPALATTAPTGRRLEDLLGCPVEGFARTVNVLPRHDSPKAGRLAIPGYARGRLLREELVRLGVVETVVLGMDAARLMGLRWGRGADLWFRWEVTEGLYYAIAPHPSGRSLWWNDPKNVERARSFFREVAEREKGRTR